MMYITIVIIIPYEFRSPLPLQRTRGQELDQTVQLAWTSHLLWFRV